MIDCFILNKDLSYNELGQPTAKSIHAAHREIQKLQNLRKKVQQHICMQSTRSHGNGV